MPFEDAHSEELEPKAQEKNLCSPMILSCRKPVEWLFHSCRVDSGWGLGCSLNARGPHGTLGHDISLRQSAEVSRKRVMVVPLKAVLSPSDVAWLSLINTD